VNWDQIEGNWKQLKGRVKEKWGKLTDDQLDQLAGNRDQLLGKIQEQYGISKEEAEKSSLVTGLKVSARWRSTRRVAKLRERSRARDEREH
jgi:uncharacterized protein YjbJ (UPF0337 family)